MSAPLTIGFLLFPELLQMDFTGPYGVFAAAPDARIHLVWKNTQPVLSSDKLALTPTTTLAECPPLVVICVPGGGGVQPLLGDEETLAFLRCQAAGCRYVTSVCTGALVLGAAGLLPIMAVPPLVSRKGTFWVSSALTTRLASSGPRLE